MRVSASMQREFAQRCGFCEATAVFTSDVLPVLSRRNERSQFAEVVEYQDDFWQVLRPNLVAGRLPQPLRKGGPAGQAVVSAALWRSIFLDEPFGISSRVFIDGKPFEVVGMVTTQANDLFGRTGIWIEKQDLSGSSNTDQIGLVRTSQFAQAQAMLHAATPSLKALGGLSWASKVDGYSLCSTSAYLRSRMVLSEPALFMELAICAFCSLICFATIVFLQLLIGMKRSTIEWTLGAGAWQAMFGRAKEQSGTILIGGLLAGLIFHYATSLSTSIDLLNSQTPTGLQPAQIAAAVTAIVALQFGLLILLTAFMHKSFGTDKLLELLRGQGTGSVWRRQQMVGLGVQYFIALLGLVLSLGFVVQLNAMRSRETGLKAESRQLIAMRLPRSLENDPNALAEKTRKLLTALEAAGGAGEAVVTNGLPFLQVHVARAQVYQAKRSPIDVAARIVSTTPNYFPQLGVRILAGGVWRSDQSGLVVVNRALANLMGGPAAALGSELRLEGSPAIRAVVSGVCEDTMDAGENFERMPAVYISLLALPSTDLAVWLPSEKIPSVRWAEDLQVRDSSFSLYFMKGFRELVDVLSAPEAVRVKRFGFMAAAATASTLFSLGYLIVSALRSNWREYAIMFALGCRPQHLISGLVSKAVASISALSLAAVLLGQQLAAKFSTVAVSPLFSGGLSLLAAALFTFATICFLAAVIVWTTRHWGDSLPGI
jgi:hypothetical protein